MLLKSRFHLFVYLQFSSSLCRFFLRNVQTYICFHFRIEAVLIMLLDRRGLV